MIRNVSCESIPISAPREQVVDRTIDAGQAIFAPVDVFITVVMISHGARIVAEQRCKAVETSSRLRAIRGMGGGVVITDLEPIRLKALEPGNGVRMVACHSIVRSDAIAADRPHRLRRPQSTILEKRVNLAPGV